jgi:hypothetical membrane protein
MVLKRAAACCGLLAVLVIYVSIFTAALLSPSFSWTTNAISDLGAVGVDRSWILNGGLVAGSVLSLLFIIGVFKDSENILERAGATVLVVVYVLSGLIAVFPYGTSPHIPVALAFFALYPIGVLIYAAGNVRGQKAAFGSIGIGLAGLYVLFIVAWAVVFPPSEMGIAIPELVGGLVLDFWIILTSFRLLYD